MTCRRLLLCLACGATLATSVSRATLTAQSAAISVHGTVTTVPATGLITKPANLLDLEGTTVTFTPDGADGYTLAVGGLTWEDPGGAPSRAFSEPARTQPNPFEDRPQAITTADMQREDSVVELPFAFPFAGRTWTRVHANVNGNISFEKSERMLRPHGDLWGGTMRSVAAAIDSRSAAGLEAMIAVLWALYGDTTISVDATSARTVITWQAVRPTPSNIYYEPLGENSFQARLYPSGAIELAYRAVAERDGIVGLFHGLNSRGRTLDTLDATVGNVALGVLDITRIELVDNGSTVLVRMTLAEDVPERVAEGTINYKVFLSFGNIDCEAGLEVTTSGRSAFLAWWCIPAPRVVGYQVHGATIEIPISKTLLSGQDHFSWAAEAVWWEAHQFDSLSERRTVHVGEPDYDLATAGTVAGNVFEVFHYPTIPQETTDVMSLIYARAPANDEIAVPFTDFRTDDLYSSGPGSGPINAPVQGIGEWQASPTPGEWYGSDNLLVTMVPLFIGAPPFTETGVSWGRPFRNFGYGINWIAHEAVHRWSSHLQFRSPRTGRVEDLLADDGCRCHWSNWLHAPAVHPVWPGYAGAPYSEASVMGGAVWLDNGDGTFTREDGNPLPTGLSALDLYVMGMIPPSEVPETFLLRDVQETGTWGRVRATKVPVGIDDIVAATGPRVPAADASRKEFRLGVYLLHEDRRPPRMDLVEHAQAVARATAEYFAAATGGRMRVVPTLDPAANLLPVPVGALAPLTLPVGVGVQVGAAAAFRDPDGDPLTYAATSSSPRVASVAVSAGTVTVTAAAPGVATVTVTATDTRSPGTVVTQTFTVTVAVSTSFTDDPIVPGVTPVRAIHFAELRVRIDALREAAGLDRFGWTDPIVTAGVTRVRRVHLLELREALATAYTAVGRAAPGWTDAAPVAGATPIRAVHLMELRAAVVALE